MLEPFSKIDFTNEYIEYSIRQAMQEAEHKFPNVAATQNVTAILTHVLPFRERVSLIANDLFDLKKLLPAGYDSGVTGLLYAYISSKVADLLGNLWGCCGEVSTAVFFSLAKNTPIRTEAITIERSGLSLQINHQIVVCNRKQNSDINAPLTWGESCYICDQFNHFYYKISAMPKDSLLQDIAANLGKYNLSIALKNIHSVETHFVFKELVNKIICAKDVEELRQGISQYLGVLRRFRC